KQPVRTFRRFRIRSTAAAPNNTTASSPSTSTAVYGSPDSDLYHISISKHNRCLVSLTLPFATAPATPAPICLLFRPCASDITLSTTSSTLRNLCAFPEHPRIQVFNRGPRHQHPEQPLRLLVTARNGVELIHTALHCLHYDNKDHDGAFTSILWRDCESDEAGAAVVSGPVFRVLWTR
ncbi:hypothetical protein LTS18_001666, partial [Coniosporium uncinatum]